MSVTNSDTTRSSVSYVCMQDPENPAMRIYKVFQSIEDTREQENVTGTSVRGTAKVSGNKAFRSTLEAHITTKAAAASAGDGLDLFGGLTQGAEQKPTTKNKNKKAKVKKEVTPEEKERKEFEKDLAQPLVSHGAGLCCACGSVSD